MRRLKRKAIKRRKDDESAMMKSLSWKNFAKYVTHTHAHTHAPHTHHTHTHTAHTHAHTHAHKHTYTTHVHAHSLSQLTRRAINDPNFYQCFGLFDYMHSIILAPIEARLNPDGQKPIEGILEVVRVLMCVLACAYVTFDL